MFLSIDLIENQTIDLRPKAPGLRQQALASLQLKSLPPISQQQERQTVAPQELSHHQGKPYLMRSLDMLRNPAPSGHRLRLHRIQQNNPIQTSMSMGLS